MKRASLFTLLRFIFPLVFCSVTSVSGVLPLLDQPAIADSVMKSGEILEYGIKIKGIPAGTQMFQINGKKQLNGQEVYHVESVSKIRKLFNIFYPFSNRSESFIQSESFQPLRYTQKIRDGKYRGNIDVDFDPANNTARITKNQERLTISVPPGIQDELSMIYLFRSRELEVGKKYRFPVLTGVKTVETIVSVLRVEMLKTVLGTLRTIVVRTNPKNITIWLTDDNARIPVRIEAKTKIGKLVSNLKAVH